ncbi:hypothetical protein [Nonomuraea gerenzanensis]|uniref:Uncharacterized protein n=1 Tax=Nonomuraea gerenzanensis TaxID=93944 RepID=A0A1M4E514_9ACTN|nr:hypothetical protein [Nonomuraea gerenzanensis]UBU16121.1 hypothetical protein LCN96_14240 [Nonomuraea gerenzanensis]SBO93927.1 hypothetical protein BN4615_P3443 [Nonomuraea gerenzanensis]
MVMPATRASSGKVEKQNPGQLNSVQLNIVTLVDMEKATEHKSLAGAMYMVDNSVGGSGQGTARLETVCKPGQVLNWIIRPIDMERRRDGTWPPMPKINNIVFLDVESGDEEDVAEKKVCVELKIYGAPDRMRDDLTPVYYYWAGTVLPSLRPGTYRYRLVVELEQEHKKERLYLNTEGHPSIRVIPV